MIENKKKFQNPYKRQILQIAQMAHYQPIASINQPSKDFNYTILASNILKKKQKVTLLNQSRDSVLDLKQQNKASFNKKITKLPKIMRPQLPQTKSHIQQQPSRKFITVDTRIDTKTDTEQGSLTHDVNIVKKKKYDRKITQSMSPSSGNSDYRSYYKVISDQSENDQYQKEATPGPGYYVLESTSFSKPQKSNIGSFGSKSIRFSQIQQAKKAKEDQDNQKVEKIKKMIKFKQNKVPFNSMKQKTDKTNNGIGQIPGPQDYNPRIGIQQQLIRRIQRNFKGNFGIDERRFKTLKQWDNLGPGRYNPELSQEQSHNHNKESYFFASKQHRFGELK